MLLTEWTTSESLRKHALAVDAAVRGYARLFGEDEAAWGVVALLHDFDYEGYQTAEDHPFRGCEELQRRGYPEWVTRAILSHADYSGVARESRLEKTLYACDEMSGFVTAASLVRPSKSVLDLEPSSVIKRMKDRKSTRLNSSHITISYAVFCLKKKKKKKKRHKKHQNKSITSFKELARHNSI